MPTQQLPRHRRVAVVGSGVAGLTAAWVLHRSSAVTLYEAADRLGGHADTHDLVGASGTPVAVDTGFIVHNRRTYPTLVRLFDELGVETQESDMSMSVHCEGCGLEYAGARRLPGLFPQGLRSLRPPYLRMLPEVTRFHRQARALLATAGAESTLGDFVRRGGYSDYFRRHFLVPVVAAVWSTAPSRALDYPARYLFAFLHNHGMLAVTGSPVWRTVVGGSRTYVERVAKELTAQRTGAPVTSVRRRADGVDVTADGSTERYDAIVVATHPHQALSMLADATPAERRLLGAISYTRNESVLHDDARVLPRTSGAAASWNVRLPSCRADQDAVLVSYDLNRLQRLPALDRYVLTLNPGDRVPEGRVLARMEYEHPLYTTASVAAQRRLPEISTGRTAFAGAYHGWGFHEDGARSGVRAAAVLGATW